MHLLNGAAILAAQDRRTVEVDCPEWGGGVLVGEMGALTNARLLEWWWSLRDQRIAERSAERATRRRDETPEEEESTEPLSCDSPPPTGEAAETLSCDSPPDDDETTEPIQDGDLSMMRLSDHVEWRLRYVAASILDPQTLTPAFTDDQVEALGNKNKDALQRIYAAAQALNREREGDGKELEKNSATTEPGVSGSV